MPRRQFWTSLAVLSTTCLILAQGSDTTVATRATDALGTYLVDGQGASLYLFTNDADGESACYEQCATNWPPLMVEGEPTAGEGADASLLGTTERTDGARQVTYGGHPLYTFARDEAPGDTAGQGVGGVWYLVSPAGDAVGATEPDTADEGPADGVGDLEALMAEGASIYERTSTPTCATCHGDEGEGVSAPALAGSRTLENPARTIRQILRGGQFMPSFGEQLTDHEVAAVTTYIRNSFGNDLGAITDEEVAEQR